MQFTLAKTILSVTSRIIMSFFTTSMLSLYKQNGFTFEILDFNAFQFFHLFNTLIIQRCMHKTEGPKFSNVLEILQSSSNLKHEKLLGKVPVSSHQCRNIV